MQIMLKVKFKIFKLARSDPTADDRDCTSVGRSSEFLVARDEWQCWQVLTPPPLHWSTLLMHSLFIDLLSVLC